MSTYAAAHDAASSEENFDKVAAALVADDPRPDCWLKVDHRTGQVSYGDDARDRISLTSDNLLTVAAGSFRHGYIIYDAEGRPGDRHMVALSSGQPRPEPPGGSYAKFGEVGPRRTMEVGFTFMLLDEFPDDAPSDPSRPLLTFTTPSWNAGEALKRLLNAILAQLVGPTGKAGYIHPVIEVRPGSFMSRDGARTWHFDWTLRDWLHVDGRLRQSGNRRFGAELAIHYEPPAPSVPQFREIAEQLEANGWQGVPEFGVSRVPVKPGWLKPRPAKVWLRATEGEWRVLYTSILTRSTPALDIDVTDRDLADELEALALEVLGLGLPRIGRAPKRMLFYRHPSWRTAPLGTTVLQLRKGDEKHLVEFLASRHKATAFAPHQKTGLSYTWPHGSPLDVSVDELPAITRAEVKQYMAAAARLARQRGWETRRPANGSGIFDDEGGWTGEPLPGYGEADADIVASALERIPNNDLPYDDWIRIGLAIRHGLGRRAGEPLWLWWSSTSRKFNQQTTLKTWRAKSFEPRRITVHFLYSVALWGWRQP